MDKARLASAVNLLKYRLEVGFFRWVNLICGCVIMCYGIKLLFDFTVRFLA